MPIDLDQYSSKAVDTFVESIRNSTRFELNNIQVFSKKSNLAIFTIALDIDLKIVSETKTHKGKPLTSERDRYANNKMEHHANIERMINEERDRQDTIKEASSHYSSQGYGVFRQAECFRINPSKCIYTYHCESCGGSGQYICSKCNGHGEIVCGNCNGHGKKTCSKCGGTGIMKEIIVMKEVYGKCDKCYGKGITSCSSCGSSGRVRCSNCGGSGKVQCSTCGGTGRLTDITTISVISSPEYRFHLKDETSTHLNEILNLKIALPDFLTHGNLELKNISENFSANKTTLYYDASLVISEIDIQIEHVRKTIIVFGENFTLFDSGGMLGELLRVDANALCTAAEENAITSLMYIPKINLPVKNFMDSEAHQNMLTHYNLSKNVNIIYENMGRSLTIDYIELSILQLKHIVQNLAFKIGIEFLVLWIIISYGIAFFYDNSSTDTFLYASAIITFLALSIYSFVIHNIGKESLLSFSYSFIKKMGFAFVVAYVIVGFVANWSSGFIDKTSNSSSENIESIDSDSPKRKLTLTQSQTESSNPINVSSNNNTPAAKIEIQDRCFKQFSSDCPSDSKENTFLTEEEIESIGANNLEQICTDQNSPWGCYYAGKINENQDKQKSYDMYHVSCNKYLLDAGCAELLFIGN